MKQEPNEVCKPCVFFNGEHCEFFFENTIVDGKCITKIDRYEGNDPRSMWTCCGGIKLHQDEKCSICGEGYE